MKFSKMKKVLQFSLLLGFVLLTSCTAANNIATAQDYFNKAAEAENSLKFSGKESSNELVGLSNIRTNYSLANKFIKDALQDSSSLKSDKLLGVAYSIKAISEWRLGSYDDALTSSDLAKNELESETSVPGRDLAVMTALPGLIRIDQAYYYISQKDQSKNYSDVLGLISDAIEKIKAAQKVVAENHPVQAYLQMSKLTAYRNFQLAIEVYIQDATQRRAARQKLIPMINDELQNFKKLVSDKSSIEYWEKILGV